MAKKHAGGRNKLEFQIIDMLEAYDPETLDERVCLIGKDVQSRLVCVEVYDVPNEVYIAVGEDLVFRSDCSPGDADFKANTVAETRTALLVGELEEYMRQNPHGCCRTVCECRMRRDMAFLDDIYAQEDEDADEGGRSVDEEGAPSRPRRERGNNGQSAMAISREPCKRRRVRVLSDVPKVRKYSIVHRRGFHGFERDTRPFLRLELTHAFYAAYVERWLDQEDVRKSDVLGAVSEAHRGVYECRAKPVDSFLVTKNIASFDWVRFSPASEKCYKQGDRYIVPFSELAVLRDADGGEGCVWDDGSDKEDAVRAPVDLVALYLDIETIAKKYVNSESDRAAYPVGVLSCVTNTGTERTFMLGEAFGGGPHVQLFSSEVELFRAFARFLRDLDPDIISGYNINRFDIPYLLRRAEVLGVEDFALFSRLRNEPVLMRQSMNQAKQRMQVTLDCPGRIFMDIYTIIVNANSYRLENYKLATVAEFFGLDAKGDVAYDEIHGIFHGGPEGRLQLEQYCLRDAQLPREIEQKIDGTRRLMAKCKILRLRARDALDRGLGYVLSLMIAAEYRSQGYLNKKAEYATVDGERKRLLDEAFKQVEGYKELWALKERREKYPGAFVFEPLRGYYEDAILTLDFNSLYPSIIQTMNVCRSTQMNSSKGLTAEEANVSPPGFAYNKSKEGIFPRIERVLVSARKAVRARIKKEADASVRAMLDAEQNELKIAANSLYGLLGTISSEVSFLSGAYSITAWGAYFIRRVKDAVVAHYGGDVVEVVYGDTDSLFLRLKGVRELEQARELSKDIERWVNTTLDAWIKHEFKIENGVMKMEAENISMRTLLLDKKMYVKYVYSVEGEGNQEKGKIKKSGVETRTSTMYARETVDRCLRMRIVEERTPDEIALYIQQRVQTLYMGEIEDLAQVRSSTKLSKPVEEYPNDSPHIIAAKQMLAKGMTLHVGDRVEYYFCDVQAPRNAQKREFTVCAPLVSQYELKWAMYVEELVRRLERIVQPLLGGRYTVEDITHESRFARRKVVKCTTPPERALSATSAAMKASKQAFFKRFERSEPGNPAFGADDGGRRGPPRIVLQKGFHQASVAQHFASQTSSVTVTPPTLQPILSSKQKRTGASKRRASASGAAERDAEKAKRWFSAFTAPTNGAGV